MTKICLLSEIHCRDQLFFVRFTNFFFQCAVSGRNRRFRRKLKDSDYYKLIKKKNTVYALKNKQYKCNLSSYTLSNSEYCVLSKGLKFIPTPRTDISRDLEESINNLANDLRRTYYFHKHPTATYVPHSFKAKSTWQAPPGHT